MSMRRLLMVLFFALMPAAACTAAAPPALDYDMLIKYYFSQKPELAAQEGLGFDYALWRDCKKAKDAGAVDEATKRKQQEEFAGWVNSLPADTKLPAQVKVSMNGTFGHYDVEKQALMFDPIDSSTVLKIRKERARIIYNCDPVTAVWPAAFHVVFSNGDAFNGIPMSKQAAQQIDVTKGRKTRIDMTIRIDGMQLDHKVLDKAAPVVKASVVDMKVTQVDRAARDVVQLADWNAAAVQKMTEDYLEDTQGAPMPANTASFALWADKLKDAGLAQKYGVNPEEVTLKSIGMPVRAADLDYAKEHGAVPRDLREEGTVFVKPVWLRIGTTPKEIEIESDMGTIAVQFSNQAQFDARWHKISTDLLQLLLYADKGVSWTADIIFTPMVYFEQESKTGEKSRHVFRSRIERMVYTAQLRQGEESARTVFTEQTLVDK